MKRIVLAMLGGFITVFAAAGGLFLCLVFLAKGVWIHACANYTFGLELCQSAGDIFEASFVLLSRRWAKYCYDVLAVTPKTLQGVFTRLWTEALNSLTCSEHSTKVKSPGLQEREALPRPPLSPVSSSDSIWSSLSVCSRDELEHIHE